MASQEQKVSEIWKEIVSSGLMDDDDTAVVFYSITRLHERLGQLRSVFSDYHSVHTVAIKTNPQQYILRQVVNAGFGLEAASFEEVKLAVEAGAPFDRITYNSPVKTKREIAYCEMHYPGLRLNVNSLEELDRMSAQTPLNIGLRINPLIHAGSNELYNVSGEGSKFGVSINQRDMIIEQAIRHSVGTLHLHVGSQVGDIAKVVEAIAAVTDMAEAINQRHALNNSQRLVTAINIGGGLPAGADPESSLLLMREYVALISDNVPKLLGYQVITEFGQWVHKHQGITFSQVEYVKELTAKNIAYIHVGADLFMREAYSAMNELDFVCLTANGNLSGENEAFFDIAGPLCFNGDYLGKDKLLPAMRPGDILAIPSTGANSYGLWSRHCSRTVPAIFADNPETGRIQKIESRIPIV